MTASLSLNQKTRLSHPSPLDSYDYKSKPQQKMLFQLNSAANHDCTSEPQHSTDNDAGTSKPQQENKAFPSQGLDTYDGLRQEDSAPAALILTTKMLF